MKGMDTIIALRQRGAQPSCVMVELVDHINPRQDDLSLSGIVTVQVPHADSLSDLDMRPLVGLHVQVFDYAGDMRRHRRLCRLIAKANPRLLAMPVTQGESYTLHVRHAGGQTRSYRA